MSTIKRISPYAMTAAVTLVFYWVVSTLILPSTLSNLNFWGLWFGGMLLGVLPLMYLEVAYAKRARALPITAMSDLTRQSDSPKFYRVAAWLGFFALSAGMIGLINEAQLLSESLAMGRVNLGFKLTDPWVLAVLSAAVFAVAALKLQVLPIIAAVGAVIALLVSGFDLIAAWHISRLSLWDAGFAVGLGVAGSLVGSGLYWQMSLSKHNQSREPVSIVISLWAIQLISGVLFACFAGANTPLGVAAMSVALLLVACALAPLIYNLLLTRFKSPFSALGVIALMLVFWSLPLANNLLWMTWLSVLLLACLTHAIFAGWNMKISHLRKSLKFDTEVGYNLWRVMIRLVVPLLVAFSLISFWQTLLVR